MEAVTYGPFPGGWPDAFDPDFSRMIAAGFNAIRLYELPDRCLLDAASRHGLMVFGGLKWGQSADFLGDPGIFSAAAVALTEGLRETAGHSALAGVFVGNEISSDLVRWMGPVKVRQAIEALIRLGHELAPGLLFAYANYPSTEYLEPDNADFSAFNVYLESETEFRSYLKRLHHIAGDRPLVISEFGLDSRRNGTARQAESLSWARQAARHLETAGMTVYAWSDRWWNADAEVLDWDFGLFDRQGLAKPAYFSLQSPVPNPDVPSGGLSSVIVCTRNGRNRIGACLGAIAEMLGGAFETIVVDDGSSDGTADFVATNFPHVRLLRLAPCGLSRARNAGATAARGGILAFTDDDCAPDRDWILRIRLRLEEGQFAAVGGPNLPPPPKTWEEAVVGAAPGAPSHVMLDDDEAEHLPGCNLVVTRSAFDAIGGFDPQFQTAGDDVDFCWRLRDAGFRLGFAPGGFVWHRRRPSIAGFFRQQLGYGRAERLLITKHPARFSKRGGAKWLGFVYGGGPVRVMADSIIYYGAMGAAGYQAITNRTLPLRGLAENFSTFKSRIALRVVEFLQPRVRAWARNRAIFPRSERIIRVLDSRPAQEFAIDSPAGQARDYFLQVLIRKGWKPGGDTDAWDLEKAGVHLQMATEHGPGIAKRTLIRVRGGDPVEILGLLEEK